MSTRSHVRLLVLHVLVLSLLAALLGRLWYLQVLNDERYERAAAETRTREVVLPPLRGEIYDSTGHALVRNKGRLVVTVSRSDLLRMPDDGAAVLRRLAKVLPKLSYEQVQKRVRLCSAGVEQPCWNGSPYQPIPVANDVSPRVALQIMERKTDFPGVMARADAVRSYPAPAGANAAQVLGHLGPITEKELEAREDEEPGLTGSTLVGRDGVEATYEKYLQGKAGTESLVVDSQGRVTGTEQKTPPVPGSHLITSINAKVQKAAEDAIRRAIDNARAAGKPAESAAAVVLDVRTGRVIALASVPTFDPSVWVGGISQKNYERLNSEEANNPMVFRATQGQYPVGSTFKVVSLSAAVKDGNSLQGTYSCPSHYQVGGRSFQNYGGIGYGPISLHRAIVISCDTVFYQFAHHMWQRDGGTDPIKNPEQPIPTMAKAYGFGSRTGIDLPDESSGRVPGRKWKREYWEATRDYHCKKAKQGYPKVAEENPGRAAYLRQLSEENCHRGYVWRAGDAVNLSIGQGDLLATPLQLARAYSAIANGGTLYSPRVGKAIVRPDGTVVKNIKPSKNGTLPISDRTISYIQDALADVPRRGTAAGAFAGFPLDRIPVAGKTGTAESYESEDTAWFASYAPADNPRYAVAAMVVQGGLGSSAAAPAVRDIYESIYGIGKKEPAISGGAPPGKLPHVTQGGQVKPPAGYPMPTPGGSATASESPASPASALSDPAAVPAPLAALPAQRSPAARSITLGRRRRRDH